MIIKETMTRFTGRWAADITVEPGSVPDRPIRHSRNGAWYRPASLHLEFTAHATGTDPYALAMENGSGYMRTARNGLRLDLLTICGFRLKKDGTPGLAEHEEKIWSSQAEDTQDKGT